MLNLMRMDLHRLVRTFSFWVMIGVTIFIAFFSAYMTDYDVNSQDDTVVGSTGFFESETSPEDADVIFGIHMETDPSWADGNIDFTDYINSNMSSLLLAILCVIFPPLFVNAEQKNGFVKNIAGQLPNRGMLILSKLFTAAVQVLVIFGVFTMSTAVMGAVLWGDRLVLESVSDFTKIFGLHYLLHFSFASFAIALTVLLRSAGFSMTFGILCTTGITSLLYGFVNILIQRGGGPADFNIGSYTLESCIAIVNAELSGADLTRVIIVGAAFLIVSALCGMMVMHKRDVR